MAKYLFLSTFSAEGVRGLLKDGGTSRVAASAAMANSLGGSLDALYFAFGDADVYTIADLPDNAAAESVALTIRASGASSIRTIVLMTPAEVDGAVKKTPTYRAPGHD